MQCPYCSSEDNKVIDSRNAQKNTAIRRRRECNNCDKRFTTYEQVVEFPLKVVKSDGTREEFNRSKLEKSIQVACNKLPVSSEKIENLILNIEKKIENKEGSEVKSKYIGKLIMESLKELNEVAYIRYASVYKKFKDLNEFRDQIDSFNN